MIQTYQRIMCFLIEKKKLEMFVPKEHIVKKISDEDVNFMGFSNIWSRPEWMICKVLAVSPPSMRPSIKLDAQQRSEDDLTHIMINIINYFFLRRVEFILILDVF